MYRVPGIRDLATIKCGIRETLTGYDIWLLPGKQDSPKFGHGCGIGKENDIRDNEDRSSGCEIPVKASGNAGSGPSLIPLYYITNLYRRKFSV